MSESAVDALVALGEWLRSRDYAFTTVTPATHARVNARESSAQARGVTDVFGWSRPFQEPLLPRDVMGLLEQACVLERHGERFLSGVRFSTLFGELFAHSAFPTSDEDAVFFGPDTYRFAGLIRSTLVAFTRVAGAPLRVVDVGCGSAAGGVIAARTLGQGLVIGTDINERALAFARANCLLAGLDAELRLCDLLAGVEPADVLLANPPYMVDSSRRQYRDGGGERGAELSHRIVHEAVPRLKAGGMLVLYTGSAVVGGRDLLREGIEAALVGQPVSLSYEEIDPDVFGEELASPAYQDVDRIAAVGAVLRREA